MKKFLPVALAATMVFAAVGCSKTAETEAPEASETVIEESVVETSEVTEETAVETDETAVETESDIVKMWSDLGDVAREDLPEELQTMIDDFIASEFPEADVENVVYKGSFDVFTNDYQYQYTGFAFTAAVDGEDTVLYAIVNDDGSYTYETAEDYETAIAEIELAATEAPVDASGETDEALIGTWEYEDGGFSYVFNDDGTGTYVLEGSDDMTFTWGADGSTVSITYDGSTSPTNLEYSIDGDQLTIIDSFGSPVVYISTESAS